MGTFMGLRIISQLAADLAASRRFTPSPSHDNEGAAGEAASAPPAPGQGQQQGQQQQGGGSEPGQSLQPVGELARLVHSNAYPTEQQWLWGSLSPQNSACMRTCVRLAAKKRLHLLDESWTKSSSLVLSKDMGLCTGGGYLANVPPSQFAASYELALPTEITGADFLRQVGSNLSPCKKTCHFMPS